MSTFIVKDQQYLTQAQNVVRDMLTKKQGIWSSIQPVFSNFDITADFGVSAFQFGLSMCALKLNRLKNTLQGVWGSCRTGGTWDSPEVEDSLIDLASYAILTLGLLYRDRGYGQAVSFPDLQKLREDWENGKISRTQFRQHAFGDTEPEATRRGIEAYTDAYLCSDEGKAEITKLAQEMMAEDSVVGNIAMGDIVVEPSSIGPCSLAGKLEIVALAASMRAKNPEPMMSPPWEHICETLDCICTASTLCTAHTLK